MTNKPLSVFHYLPINKLDEKWGIVCSTSGFQQVVPNGKYPVQQHPTSYNFSNGRILNEYQLVYITEGSGTFTSASCPTTEVKAGTVIMLFPHEWHNYAPNPKTGWKEFWVGFKGPNIDRRVSEGFFTKASPLMAIGLSAGIENCYLEIIRESEHERKGFQILLSSIVLHILGSVTFKNLNRDFDNNPVVYKINQAKELMREHINSNISIENIASQLNIKYTWFRRMFKNYVGISPAQYMLQLKCNYAKELLTNTKITSAQISSKLGFENPSQFTTFFKNREGVTPRDYRNSFGYVKESRAKKLAP